MDGAGTVANSQCTVTLSASSADGEWQHSHAGAERGFASSFGGNKVVYTAARDVSQKKSGWQTMGVRGVPPLPTTFPKPVGMSPSSGSHLNQTITFTYQDQSARPTSKPYGR